MSRQSDSVKRWRKANKQRIIDSMGGNCQICGYSKSCALELHHKNPKEKDFGIGQIRGNPISWTKIVTELRKCVLVCSNCHKEIHEGITVLPINVCQFDESFSNYKENVAEEKRKSLIDSCPVCGKDKKIYNRYCSLTCSGKSKQRVDWDNVDLLTLKKTKSNSRIAEELNISEAAVRKRLKKIPFPRSRA